MARIPGPIVGAAGAYYAVAGVLALLIAVGAVASAASAGLSGCELIFSQGDFRPPSSTGPLPDGPACQQYVDVVSILLTTAVGIMLGTTAISLYRRRVGRALAIIGGLAGIAAAVVPGWALIWLTSYYGGTVGPVEIGLAGLPVTVGAGGAWTLWQVHRLSVHAGPAAAET